MLEANYLTILLKPNYEKAVDTAQDILDRGLTVIYPPGTGSLVEILKSSPSNITRELAEITFVPKVKIFCHNPKIYSYINFFKKDWPQLEETVKEGVMNGSSVYQVSYMSKSRFTWGKWHKSKDTMGGKNPFGSFMLNKKWTLDEEFTNHMLRFQQVVVNSSNFSKLHVDNLGWIDDR